MLVALESMAVDTVKAPASGLCSTSLSEARFRQIMAFASCVPIVDQCLCLPQLYFAARAVSL